MHLDFNEFDVFTEKYYGKSKTLRECENLCNEIIEIVLKEPLVNVNKLKSTAKLESMLKNEFNFDTLRLYWSGNNLPNAFTLVNTHFSHVVTGDQIKLLSKERPEAMDGDKCVIRIDKSVITKAGLTGGELLAIILHEIGHNLDYTPYSAFILMLTTLQGNIRGLVSEALSSNLMKSGMFALINTPSKFIQRFKLLNIIFDTLSKVAIESILFIRTAIAPLNVLQTLPFLLLTPITNLSAFGSRRREEYADSVAASLGYGVEVASALNKIDNIVPFEKSALKNDSFFSFFYDMAKLEADILETIIGSHGTSQNRTKIMINKLKADLSSNDFPPDVKDDITAELRQLEEIYDKYILMNDTEKRTCTMCFRALVEKYYEGNPEIYRFFIKGGIGNVI